MCEQSPATRAQPIVYTLDVQAETFQRHDPSQPVVFWDDAAVTRGEAVFESVLVRAGHAANLRRHLARLQRSAQRLDLPVPQRDLWQEATAAAVADWQEQFPAGAQVPEGAQVPDAKCTWTYSRGRQYVGPYAGQQVVQDGQPYAGEQHMGPTPTAWLVITPVPDSVLQQRRDGVRAQLAPRGWSTTVGAKTVNYAATMSALRQARGFDDVIFVEPASDALASDALASAARVLEGATSTVLLVVRDPASGKRTMVTPDGDVLAGTTVAAVFDYARDRGWACENRPVTVAELYQAESVWLVSSVRIAVRVIDLGGTVLPEPANHEEIRELIVRALSV